MCEAAAYQGNSPSIITTERFEAWASAVFLESQKPVPVLAQLVVRHVCLAGSKMRTPSSFSLTITCLDSSNRSFRVLFHTNLEPGFSSCLKGYMCEALVKA